MPFVTLAPVWFGHRQSRGSVEVPASRGLPMGLPSPASWEAVSWGAGTLSSPEQCENFWKEARKLTRVQGVWPWWDPGETRAFRTLGGGGEGTPSGFSDPRSINPFCCHTQRPGPSQSTVAKRVGDAGAHREGSVRAVGTQLLQQTWQTVQEGQNKPSGSLPQSQHPTPVMTPLFNRPGRESSAQAGSLEGRAGETRAPRAQWASPPR